MSVKPLVSLFLIFIQIGLHRSVIGQCVYVVQYTHHIHFLVVRLVVFLVDFLAVFLAAFLAAGFLAAFLMVFLATFLGAAFLVALLVPLRAAAVAQSVNYETYPFQLLVSDIFPLLTVTHIVCSNDVFCLENIDFHLLCKGKALKKSGKLSCCELQQKIKLLLTSFCR